MSDSTACISATQTEKTTVGVIDYGICCDECGYEIEEDVTGYWRDNVTGAWIDVPYCYICVWDFVKEPKRVTAEQILRRQEQARLEQERLSVPESERRRIREEREERERRYQREHEEEMEERKAERERQEVKYRKNLSITLAMQESQRIQKRTRQLEMEKEEDSDIYDSDRTRLTCEYTGPEEHDPKYDYDSLQEEKFVHTRCYDWDPKTGFEYDMCLSRDSYYVQEDEEDLFPKDPLPNNVEELYEYLEAQWEPVSIVPEDAIKLDEDFICCETYDQAKEVLTEVACGKDDISQLLSDDSYAISQQNGRFWYVLRPVQSNPTKFSVCVYASKDEVATKYLIRELEDCMYRIDYILYPEDYQEDYQYEEQEQSEYATEEDADHYLKNQDPCFMCSKFNYANVMVDADRRRIICRDCYSKVHQCCECDTITKEQTYYNFDTGVRLCFDCQFKTEESVQMPLEEHLLVRRDIQHLRKPHFDVLVDYAALAEFTIFDAYRYKSRCHFFDCIQRMSPSGWCAEETLAFCCRRHVEHADEVGCHCTNVWSGNDYDDEYAEATCKICNSPHKENVKIRNSLNKSGEGVNPIVSAICMFNQICMSNVLSESLVDLCQYFR